MRCRTASAPCAVEDSRYALQLNRRHLWLTGNRKTLGFSLPKHHEADRQHRHDTETVSLITA